MQKKNRKCKIILIVHRELKAYKILGQHLAYSGHKVVYASSVKKAKSELKKKKIHLIISSYHKKQVELTQDLEKKKFKAKMVLIHQKKPSKMPDFKLKSAHYIEPINLSWFVLKMNQILARQKSL